MDLYGFHTSCFKMYMCCHLYSRFVEGDLRDWQVDRRPSPAPLSVRPWHPHRERPHLDPFLDPQVPHPSHYQQPLNLWDSMFTVAPLPHPQWAPLVRNTLAQKICTHYPLVFSFLCESCLSLIQHGQVVITDMWGALSPFMFEILYNQIKIIVNFYDP